MAKDLHFISIERRSLYLGQFWEGDGNHVVELIHQLAVAIPHDKPIYVWINSSGGLCREGFPVVDALRMLPHKIVTICNGITNSMAVPVLALGQQRYILEHASIMVHEFWDNYEGRTTYETIKHQQDLIKQQMNWYAEVLAEHTNEKSPEFWRKKMVPTRCYIYPQEAVKLGLVDEILTDLSPILKEIKN